MPPGKSAKINTYTVFGIIKIGPDAKRRALYGGTSASEFELFGYEKQICVKPTKLAERVVVDTLTVTNDIGRNYTENAELAKPLETEWN